MGVLSFFARMVTKKLNYATLASSFFVMMQFSLVLAHLFLGPPFLVVITTTPLPPLMP